MINTLRGDFYRLFRTKGFWLAQVVLLVVIVGSVASQSVVSFMVNDITTTEPLNQALTWTGTVALESMNAMASTLLFFLWPLLIIVMGQDFAKQTYKNNLTVGISRTAYFLAKYLTMTTVVVLQLFYFYFVSFITGTFLHGVGQEFNFAYLTRISLYFLIQVLLLSAVISLAILVLYATGNTIATVLTGVMTPMIIMLLTFSFPKISWLSYFNFQSAVDDIMALGLDYPDLPKIILTASLTIGLMITASLLAFKRKEL